MERVRPAAPLTVESFEAVARPAYGGGTRFSLHRFDPPGEPLAPPVLLLHGMPETALMWRRLAPELARDRVVLAPDLKGLGASEARGPYDLATLVGELADLVGSQVTGPVDVVGHGWGGVLALALAGRPGRIRRLAVADAPYRHVGLLHAWQLLAVPRLPGALLASSRGRAVAGMIDHVWRAPAALEPDVLLHYVVAYAAPERLDAMLAYYRASLPATLRSRLRRGGPSTRAHASRALVLWGAYDPALPIHVGESVAKRLVRELGEDGVAPDAVRMVTVAGAGHFVVEEAPEEAVEVLTAFLRAP